MTVKKRNVLSASAAWLFISLMLFSGCGMAEAPASTGTSAESASGTSAEPAAGEAGEGEDAAELSGEQRTNAEEISDAEIPGADPVGETVTSEGPYGSISLTVPESWDAELLGVDDESPAQVDYGIRLSLSATPGGFVEVGYNDRFGVCGTGLETKETVIAGAAATVGFYDGRSIWDYVSFAGKNQGIIAVLSNAESWDAESAEEALDILDSLVFDRGARSGAIGFYEADAEIEELGILVSLKKITPTGAVLVIDQYDREKDGEFLFGEQMLIERKDGEEWKAVPVLQDVGFTDIGYVIEHGAATEHAYDWSVLYGALAPGEYRFRTDIVCSDAGQSNIYTAYAHFIIADGEIHSSYMNGS